MYPSALLKTVLILTFLLYPGCKKEREGSVILEKENHPPQITSLNITPPNPNSTSTLSAIALATDEDRDNVRLNYRWLVNNAEIGVTESSLLPVNFKKGDTVTVIVSADDGKIRGEEVSISVLIANLPPDVRSIRFQPELPTVLDNIKAVTEVNDPDGDNVTLSYTWYGDGQVIEGVNTEILPSRFLKKGSRISVEVIPSDGEATGISFRSQEIIIANAPPVITSSPPASLQGDTYVYRVIASDPDGDPVSFSLENSPQGMSIDSKTGILTWKVNQEEKGPYTFQVIAEDTDGSRGIQSVTVGF